MECVIDTNVLVYDTLEDSEFHEAATTLLETIDRWLLTTVVVEEFISVMAKLGVKKEFLAKKIEELLSDDSTELVAMEPEDFRSATKIVSRERVRFRSFNDKLVLAVAKRRDAQLLTFDRELDRERRSTGVRSPMDAPREIPRGVQDERSS